jgi:hypothetical protein
MAKIVTVLRHFYLMPHTAWEHCLLVLRNDLYRFGKSKLLYGILALTVITAMSLAMLVRQDIRLNIAVFGNVASFRNIDDVVRMGFNHNGLGIFATVLLSVFIGQEYLWKTWQHKWIANNSRAAIYLSKLLLSSATSAAIFLIFQSVVLLVSGQAGNILTAEYAAIIVGGTFIYAALGAVVCMLSMLIKNITASIIVSLCYVLFSGQIALGMLGVVRYNLPEAAFTVVQWFVRHSIFGMRTALVTLPVTACLAAGIVINAVVVMAVSTLIGMIIFRRYEL